MLCLYVVLTIDHIYNAMMMIFADNNEFIGVIMLKKSHALAYALSTFIWYFKNL